MTSGIEFNKSYNSSYIMLPLQKMKDENGKTLMVCSSDKELDAKINARNSMANLDELRQADSDGDGVLTLEELRNCKDKTEFLENLEKAMAKFNSNPNMDYTKNRFEDWVGKSMENFNSNQNIDYSKCLFEEWV